MGDEASCEVKPLLKKTCVYTQTKNTARDLKNAIFAIRFFFSWQRPDLQCCRVIPISEHEERFVGKIVDDKISG